MLVAFDQRHPGDGVQRVEQKMRVDLILQSQQFSFFQVFFHFPLFFHKVHKGLLLTFQLAADMEMIHQLRDLTAGEPHIAAEGVALSVAQDRHVFGHIFGIEIPFQQEMTAEDRADGAVFAAQGVAQFHQTTAAAVGHCPIVIVGSHGLMKGRMQMGIAQQSRPFAAVLRTGGEGLTAHKGHAAVVNDDHIDAGQLFEGGLQRFQFIDAVRPGQGVPRRDRLFPGDHFLDELGAAHRVGSVAVGAQR